MNEIFSFRTEDGRARCCILGAECLKAIYTALTTGVFLTGLLMSAGMDEAEVGITTSIPFLAGILYPLSPLLLERFCRRKAILGITRFIYHTLVIAAITCLPQLGETKYLVALTAVCLTVGNAVNILVASGFPAWHIHFLPEELRGRFYAVSGVINSIFTAVAAMTASFLADMAKSTQNELYWMKWIRLAAYAIALAELFLLLLPKEITYPVISCRGRELLVLPFQNTKFCLTMIPVFAWMMISTMTLYSSNTYLLDHVEVPYYFISLLQAMNIAVTMITMPFWYKLLKKASWFGAFQRVFLLFALYPFLHMLIDRSNYLFLLPVTLLVYQAMLAGGTLYFNNMAYIFTPEENKTAYLSWYFMVVNMGSLSGQGLSALLLKLLKKTWYFGSFPFTPTQQILLLQGLLALAFGFWFGRVLLKKLQSEI